MRAAILYRSLARSSFSIGRERERARRTRTISGGGAAPSPFAARGDAGPPEIHYGKEAAP